jgi:hypothetical protein
MYRKIGRRSAHILAGVALALCVAPFASGSQSAGAADPNNMMPTPSDSGCHKGSLPCLSDGSSLTVYEGYLGPYMLAGTDWALNGSYAPSDAGPVYRAPVPVTSGIGETDIIYEYADLPIGRDRLEWCDDPSLGGNRCDQTYVQYSNSMSWYLSDPNHGEVFAALGCHETGHSVGLLHGKWSDPVTDNQDPVLGCLRSPADHYWELGSHNLAEINATY